MTDLGVYVIVTDPVLPYRRIAEICVERGVRMLQLREKRLDDRAVLRASAEILEVTRGTGTMFVMNDRADLALLAGADALHLGQGDISLSDARRIVGPEMKIGLSTHSVDQARGAIAAGADYIGFGPVWATPTKEIPDAVVGVDLLRQVAGYSPVPVVAIGGIFPENLSEVLAAGARSFSLVRYLMSTPDLDARIRELQEMIPKLG
jgi:thiamine-phosphate pyrophosphorylase